MSETAEAQPGIVREGWLQKRGEHIRNWRARYFILFDNGDLVGFKAQPERSNYSEPLNKFTVRDCQIMATDRPRPYTFTLRGLQWTTVIERIFSVETEQEREEWVKAIRHMASRLSGDSSMGAIASSACNNDAAGPSNRDDIGELGTICRDPRRITLEKFEFLKVLGRGNYGKVVLAREKSSGKLCAVKIIKKSQILQSNELAHAITENRVLKRIKHPFLTELRYSFDTADRVCYAMEYINGGELFFHLRRARVFDEDRTRFYGAEIVTALGYLHSEGIIYRDLKLENILLDKDGHIKIADFGICKVDITYGSTTHTFCGTPEYLAPEVVRGAGEHGPAVDWWGAGVVLYEMACGRLPFYNKDQEALYTLIVSAPLRWPSTLSPACRSLLAALLTKDPARRLGAGPGDAHEVMQHQFFNTINWSDLLAKKITPPYKPQVESDTDTQYFESQFTGEAVELTPPAPAPLPAPPPDFFPQFSYQDICSSAHSAMSHLSIQSALRS